MDDKRINGFLKSLGHDIKSIKFEKTDTKIKLKIGNFFIERKITDDYEYDVKKLFEDFLTNTTAYYIRSFWEL